MNGMRQHGIGRNLGLWVGVFALLLQLVQPLAHARNWAVQNGNPLLALFCGEVAPARLAQLRQALPAELASQLDKAHAQDGNSDCKLCASVHGAHLAAGSSTGLVLAAAAALERPAAALPTAPAVALIRLPPAQAPPLAT